MPVVAEPIIQKKSFRDLPLDGKRVLVRVDYNVPLDAEGHVTDDSRIRASLPTLESLLRRKAKVILIAHLGRPKGQPNPKYSLKPTVPVLSQLLKTKVEFVDNCIGSVAYDAVAKMKAGDVLILENLRFHPEEQKANAIFGKELSSLADFFVQDAFGAVHRAHASTTVISNHLESGAGDLLEKELKFLSTIRANPARPYVAILGGAKVSDKIGVVEAFIEKVDSLVIVGAMAYTFLKAKGVEIGKSLLESDSLDFCKKILARAEERNISILLPSDHLVVKSIEDTASASITESAALPKDGIGVDIGPKTIEQIKSLLANAKTIFWNGPAGIFEVEAYSNGTMELAQSVAKISKAGATVVVGGGDSVAAVSKAGVRDDISFISTGGGASLEFLEGKRLPGVEAIPNK